MLTFFVWSGRLRAQPFGFPELLARMRKGMLGATYAPVDGGTDPLADAIGALVSNSFVGGWSGYGELAMFPGLHDIAGQAYAGGGLVCTVREDVQLDHSADFGLDDDAADVITAFGVSVCF